MWELGKGIGDALMFFVWASAVLAALVVILLSIVVWMVVW